MKRMSHLFVLLCPLALPFAALAAEARQEINFTTTADFQKGNVEGLVRIDGDQITRAAMTAGTLGQYTAATSLPTGRCWHSSAYYNGYVYTLGGFPAPGTFDPTCYVAPVTNGVVGSWSTTTAMPVARRWHTSVAYNGYIYIITGTEAGTYPTGVTGVWVAPLNSDGTIGAWSTTTALPSARYGCGTVVYNGRLYVLGGSSNQSTFLNDVVWADINTDGTLGAWTTTTALTSARWDLSATAFNGFMYVAGGSSGGQLNDAFVAPINADGSLGTWTATTSLPTGRSRHTIWALGGYVYSLGGYDGSTVAINATIVAPIAANGSLGQWTPTTAIPITPGFYSFGLAIAQGTPIVTGGYAYSTGSPLVRNDAYTNTPTPDATNASQVIALLKGEYSILVDLGTDRLVKGIGINGNAPSGGKVRLQYRLGTGTNPVLGPETSIATFPVGTTIAVPGTARWVFVRMTLDDSQRSDGVASANATPTTITDFVVGKDPVPPLDPPVAIHPVGDVSVGAPNGGIVTFEWTGATRQGLPIANPRYELQVADNAAFTNPVFSDATLKSPTAGVFLPTTDGAEVFVWRARGFDAAFPTAPPSDWTAVVVFRVIQDDNVDHGSGDCSIATSGAPGALLYAILGLLALLGARRLR